MLRSQKTSKHIYSLKPTFCCSSEHVSVNLQVLSGYISITLFSIISNSLCPHLYSVGLLRNNLFSLHNSNLWNIFNDTSLTFFLCITYCPSVSGFPNILHSSPQASYLNMHSLQTSSITLDLIHQLYNSQPSSLLILKPHSLVIIMLTCNKPSP